MRWLMTPLLRPWLLSAAAASLLLNLAMVVPSLYLLQVFDRVLASRSLETLAMLTLLASLALALGHAMDRVRALLLARAGEALEQALAPEALRAQLQAAARGPAERDPTALPDVATLRHFLASPAVQAVFDAPWLPVYLGLITLMHPALGAAAAAAGGLLFALGRLGERLLHADEAALGAARRRGAQQLDACLRHAELLAGLRMDEAAVERWQTQQSQQQLLQRRLDERGARLAAAGRTLRQAVQVAMLALGAWLVLAEHARPGIMLAATLLVGRALSPIEQLVAGWRAVVAVRNAWQRLARQPAAAAGATLPMPAVQGAVSLDRVTVLTPDGQRTLVKGVSLELAAGECLGLVGASGSGKTTLVRALLGLRAPALGAVRLDGVPLAQWPAAQLRGAFGYLPQDVALFDATVAENIARLGPVDDAAVVEAAQAAGVHRLIAGLPQGYATALGEEAARLSGGQRQRLGLARALYGRPRLVVLDEPNAHLDAEGDEALGRAVEALKRRGATVVLVSHRPGLLRWADRVAVLRDGVVERQGPRDTVLAALQGRHVQALNAVAATSAAADAALPTPPQEACA